MFRSRRRSLCLSPLSNQSLDDGSVLVEVLDLCNLDSASIPYLPGIPCFVVLPVSWLLASRWMRCFTRSDFRAHTLFVRRVKEDQVCLISSQAFAFPHPIGSWRPWLQCTTLRSVASIEVVPRASSNGRVSLLRLYLLRLELLPYHERASICFIFLVGALDRNLFYLPPFSLTAYRL